MVLALSKACDAGIRPRLITYRGNDLSEAHSSLVTLAGNSMVTTFTLLTLEVYSRKQTNKSVSHSQTGLRGWGLTPEDPGFR